MISGLQIRNRTVEWTTLREDKTGSVVQVSKAVRLEGDEAALAVPESLAAEIQRQCPELTGPVTFGISSNQLLMRVVELPTVDTNEINSMIQLQVDKLSPFPSERRASSFEVLKTTETSCRALIVTIQRDMIESVGAICLKAGLTILRIDVDVMGWWRLLHDAKTILDKGRQVIILLESEGGVIIAAQDGIPVSFKPIGPSAGISEEEYASEIAGEVGALILALDLEQGGNPVARMDFWHRDVNPEKILARLNEEFSQDMRGQSLESLPPLSEGLARRVLSPVFSVKASTSRSQGIESVIDLVPTAWRMTTLSAETKRHVIAGMALVLGIWIIGMTALITGHYFKQGRLKALEARMALLQAPADEVRALQRRVKSFEQYLDRKYSALECLREISQLLPNDVSLASFQFKKGKSVMLRGESLAVEPIIDFKQKLDSSALFEAIDMGTIQPMKRKDETVQTFQMNACIPEEKP